jgi:hypothetical protein
MKGVLVEESNGIHLNAAPLFHEGNSTGDMALM